MEGIRTYIKGVRQNMSAVTWPTKSEWHRIGLVSVIGMVVSALAIYLADLGFMSTITAILSVAR